MGSSWQFAFERIYRRGGRCSVFEDSTQASIPVRGKQLRIEHPYFNRDETKNFTVPVVRLDVLNRLAVVLEDVDPHYRAIECGVGALDHLVIQVFAVSWRRFSAEKGGGGGIT